MLTYLHAVTIILPGPDGTLKSRKPDDPALGMQFHASTHLDQHQLDTLLALVRSYGGDLTLDIVEDRSILVTEDKSALLQVISSSIEQSLRSHLGLVEGAKPDYDDARMNEMEREVRNQRRAMQALDSKLDNVASLLAQLVGQAPSSGKTIMAAISPPPQEPIEIPRAIGRVPLVPTVVPPASPEAVQQYAQSATYAQPEPVQLTPQMMEAQRKGFPLTSVPVPVVGDPTVSANPNARGHGKTPEMSSGVMMLAGPSPRSEMISFSGRTNDKGEAIFDRHELPRVGDSLRSPSLNSDIKVP